MHEAACYALAGRIASAREVILTLPEEMRYRAAGVVFEAGHPAADAGDDVAAGPLMELVVEFWPNHYMALYHAGAARFEQGSQVGRAVGSSQRLVISGHPGIVGDVRIPEMVVGVEDGRHGVGVVEAVVSKSVAKPSFTTSP